MTAALDLTPRTNERAFTERGTPMYDTVPADFARTLERENNEQRAQIAALRADKDKLRGELGAAISDLSSTYEALKKASPIVSIGQWRRVDEYRAALKETGE